MASRFLFLPRLRPAPEPGSNGFVAGMVAAQVLVQIGAFALPALLPDFIAGWDLSKTEAGWLVGIFFAAYMVSVPVLLALTDRVPARRVYLAAAVCTCVSHLGFALWADGFWWGMALRALAGIGWAGAYMPGLKAIADPLSGVAQSRAVTMHAAGVGLAGAGSFLIAGLLGAAVGIRGVFLFGAIAAAGAFLIAAWIMPGARPARVVQGRGGALLDFRPVLRNRAALGWIAGYCVHTWELAALRAWGVTFLAATIARNGAPDWLPGPAVLFTAAGLVGIAVSITGNELAQKLGRLRVVRTAMLTAAALSLLAGWGTALPAIAAAALMIVWNAAIYIDSSALTAGTVQAADPRLRGATMGLHSMAGYGGGFFGPLGVGLALDIAGADHPVIGWGIGFGHIAVVTLIGLAVLRRVTRA